LPDSPVQPEITTDNFNSEILNPFWLTPRFPIGKWADLTSLPGGLRIHALPANLFHIEPVSVCYYDCKHWYYLSKHFSHNGEIILSIWIVDSNLNKHERISETKIKNNKKLILSVECRM